MRLTPFTALALLALFVASLQACTEKRSKNADRIEVRYSAQPVFDGLKPLGYRITFFRDGSDSWAEFELGYAPSGSDAFEPDARFRGSIALSSADYQRLRDLFDSSPPQSPPPSATTGPKRLQYRIEMREAGKTHLLWFRSPHTGPAPEIVRTAEKLVGFTPSVMAEARATLDESAY